MIVVYHAQAEARALAGPGSEGFASGTWLPWPAGVDIFFVISGFIIVHASHGLYGARDGRRRFLAHRVARLVPLYWLVSGLYLAIALAVPSVLSGDGGRPTTGYVVASFLFWPVLRPDGAALPLYGLGWTLQYEVLFYALFAVGLGWGRRWSVVWIATALGLGALVARIAPNLPMPLAFWANPIILEFAFGAGLGLARAEGLRLSRIARSALGLFALVLLASASEPDASTRPLYWGLPAACLVAAATLDRDRPSRNGWVLRMVERVGDASYALYLVHPFALRLGRELTWRGGLAPTLATQLGAWAWITLMAGFAVMVALAVNRLVERPLTDRARRWLDPAERAGEKSFDGAGPRVPAGRERL